MTRKFYEEPQILVMEMDEEEILAGSGEAVGIDSMQSNNTENANLGTWTEYTIPSSNSTTNP